MQSDTLVALVSATLHDAKRHSCRFSFRNLARCKATGVSLLRFCRGLDREIGELLRGVEHFCRGLDREIGELLRGVERFCRGRLGAVFAPKGIITSKAPTTRETRTKKPLHDV
jgi:hypothetical protein